uniref:Imidazole glycerol phosphate synthase subunit HisH n=1 Tax=Candidatus Kentrum sp. MB TaxID=2138164 RepID=A0A450XEQ0_9GAMM|nr:MAG: glutamine amidotransferase [Candidatus Kentron sp. MB]VFK30245.1 MAG: glutamine amidotransferase [Candidatus Kentron sp. MB]VFK75148.1 MAG: glutamine amidotransferase [Candidatus Kentron sp. MB]
MGTIGIINIGLGNIDSVSRAIDFLDYKYSFCQTPADLNSVDKIIFPGVGSFGVAAGLLESTGLNEHLTFHVREKGKPILGICLGMQLFANAGAEGGGVGLGLIQGTVEFHRGKEHGVKIPHIGWNDVSHTGGILFNNIPTREAFYFSHSYELILSEKKPEFVGYTDHGINFVSSIEDGHIFGVQFHPEKSQKHGLQLLKNFMDF